ncbi:MAG TPA: hypothetical protein VII06_10325 [Chloroflexota bacterium]|jgi:hypothetical protein
MTNPPPAAPARVTKEFVLTKCRYFTAMQLWPTQADLDPESWLTNFQPEEEEHAVHLLNSFLYFSAPLLDRVFATAIQTLSSRVTNRGDPLLSCQSDWRAFFDRLLLTYVTGEQPNPTDSGQYFARKARQLLSIPEERILDPPDVLHALLTTGPRPILFVDDFAGSGNQFVRTWQRSYPVGNMKISFADLSKQRGTSFFYCPAFSTVRAQAAITKLAPQVTLHPGHILPEVYNALAPDSILWPPHLLPTARDFVRQASLRAGLPDTNGHHVNDWQGFARLGLAIAFAHSVPDATLPIIYWADNGWRPLIRRT